MKRVKPKRFSDLVAIALKAGATAARIIPAKSVIYLAKVMVWREGLAE